MPYKPRSACAIPGCPKLAEVGRFCRPHAEQAVREHTLRRLQQDRGTTTQQGYGWQWQQVRARYLKAHPYCVVCGQQATDVDHIRPRSQGGDDSDGNLQALCHSCHSSKTARQTGWGRR